MKTIAEAQLDMRSAYFGGATGVVTSGAAWLIAALVTYFVGTKEGIITLLVGGMAIFPVSVLLDKALGRSGKHSKDNPLASLAGEGTIWMILAMIVAVGIALENMNYFFPAMLLIIGGRYLTFQTLYGMKIYWLIGAALVAAAFVLVRFDAPPSAGAFSGALIELVFGIATFGVSRSKQ